MSGILSFIAISAITIGVGLYVTYPLIFAAESAPAQRDRSLENLKLDRERLHAELRDLELDHSMGKVMDDDYTAQREDLEGGLSTVNLALGERTSQSGAAAPQSSPKRKTRPGTSAVDVEARIREARTRVRVECPDCGASNPKTAAFCNSCGARLAKEDTDTPEATT